MCTHILVQVALDLLYQALQAAQRKLASLTGRSKVNSSVTQVM